MSPELIILDEVDHSEVRFYEEFYISIFKSWGFNLTQNSASGYYIQPHRFEKGDVVLIIEEDIVATVTDKNRSYVYVWADESKDLIYHHSKLKYLSHE